MAREPSKAALAATLLIIVLKREHTSKKMGWIWAFFSSTINTLLFTLAKLEHDKQVHSEPTKFRVCAWNNSKEASLSLQQKKGKAEKERGEVESSRYATELGQHMGGWRQKQPQATKSCA